MELGRWGGVLVLVAVGGEEGSLSMLFSLYWRFGGWGVSGGGDATTRLSVIYADASGNLYIILADFHHIFLLDERS